MIRKKKKVTSLDLINAFENDSDMSGREQDILKEIIDETGFIPKENIWRSSYWGTEKIGASHWSGIYQGKGAVLKIQGVKPDISEIIVLNEFKKQNRSKIIRPPTLYKTLAWDEKRGYEALIMEYIIGRKVLEGKKIQSRASVSNFFNYYLEYRKNCIPEKPWLEKPSIKHNWEEDADRFWKMSEENYPKHPLREKGDRELIQKASELLAKIYENVPLVFIHGHFSVRDLIYVKPGSKEVVIFSNLLWKWKLPFYDAVFGYHWFMFELEHVKGLTPQQVDSQREMWLSVLEGLPLVENDKDRRLLKAALLEKAVAGIMIDGFLMDIKRSPTKYIFDSTRKEIASLINELS